MFETFSTNALEIIDDALQIAKSLNKKLVGSEHLLLAMYKKKDTICHFLLEEKQITYDDILNVINNLVIFRKSENNNLTYSTKFQEIILFSETLAKDLGSKYVYDEHIFYVMLKEEDSIANIVIEKLGLDKEDLLMDIEEIFNFFEGPKDEENLEVTPYPFLTNLSKMKKVHPFVKRSNYIEKIIYILSKKQKNNPLLVGNAGVGKTAIIEGLSEILKDEVIYQLDLGSIVAGTKYRGELEEKITKAMEYVKKQKAIIFIDEIHNIVGAGSNDGSLDIANILKPYLSRSDIKLIGSTTLDEYYRFIEKDKALTRRFQNVYIDEPSEDETYQILEGIKDSYEEYHHLHYTKKHLRKIIRDAKFYLINKNFPDKAIDVLDEVGARHQNTHQSIDKLIDEVIEDTCGIKKISLKNLRLLPLNYPSLKKHYLTFIKRYELNPNLPNMGVIYVEEDFDSTDLMSDLNKVFGFKKEMYLEIDLENYHDMTMLNNLIGSTKGYVGFEQGGILSEHLIKYPLSLIYLKNFSHAHQSIQNFFKMIFQKRFFLDNKDRKVYLINCLFIISNPDLKTSNAGFINDKTISKVIMLPKLPKNSHNNLYKLMEKYHIEIDNAKMIPSSELANLISYALLDNKQKYHYNVEKHILEPQKKAISTKINS